MRTDSRTLNRVTLGRQLLLERHPMSAADAIGRLVGVQAQAVNAPYVGLWTRLSDFAIEDLTDCLVKRRVVRSTTLRGTQHLVRALDFGWLRALVGPTLLRSRQAAFGKQTAGLDLDELVTRAKDLLAGRTLTRTQLGRALAERWPQFDPLALGWSAQLLVPIVHPPPSGIWRRGGATPFTLASDWLGNAPPQRSSPRSSARSGPPHGPDELIRRYLTAFGPATVADMQQWSGVRGLGEVVERMDLATFPDGLYDLPDLTYETDVEAPVRLLPEFDNLMIAYADRTRIMPDEHRKRVCIGSTVAATVLVDGTVRGTWKLLLGKDSATLTVTPFERLARKAQDAIEVEAHRLLAFAAAELDDREVRWS
ncbi:winged helix DNA-binding domain-containing protein [Kribbella endophytica]